MDEIKKLLMDPLEAYGKDQIERLESYAKQLKKDIETQVSLLKDTLYTLKVLNTDIVEIVKKTKGRVRTFDIDWKEPYDDDIRIVAGSYSWLNHGIRISKGKYRGIILLFDEGE